jgi:hypothetical protein
MKLDKKTYHMKFGMEMFICRDDTIEGGLVCECHLHMDGNKQDGK